MLQANLAALVDPWLLVGLALQGNRRDPSFLSVRSDLVHHLDHLHPWDLGDLGSQKIQQDLVGPS